MPEMILWFMIMSAFCVGLLFGLLVGVLAKKG
jgi:hypothetical protein